MSGGLRFVELVRDRWRKRGLYGTPAYWDKKATAYEGLARSNWPSNAYNEYVHRRQMEVVDEALGDLAGLSVVDVGCGTGRATLHLVRRGANVTGLDFSPKALEAAAREMAAAGVRASFATHNVLEPPAESLRGRFDVVLSMGCLTLACKGPSDLDVAVSHLVSMLRSAPGPNGAGRVLFVEPIHASALLTRILPLSVSRFIEHCEAHGLRLITRRGILFFPARLALAFRDTPTTLNAPVFALGERFLDLSDRLEPLADYKVLLFRAAP